MIFTVNYDMPAEIENYVHRRILSYNIRKAWQLPVVGGINYFGSGDTEENFLSSTVQDGDAYLHVHQSGHCLLHVHQVVVVIPVVTQCNE